jgi:peptidoglycan/LPS O-acetylase OafA/YrhL
LANYLVVRYGIINEDIEQFNYRFLLFLHNFHEPFGGFFWESWSLSVEEWFYLFTPVLLLGLLRFSPPKRSFLLATLIMILLPVFYRYSLYNPAADSHFWDITFRKIVLCRLDSIGFGLLAAWLYYYYLSSWERFKWPVFFVGFSMLFCLIYFRTEHHTIFKQVFHYTFIPLGIMFLLPLFNSIKKGYGYFGKAITHISKISYSMYLVNLALVACVIRDNFPPTSDADSLIKYLIYWIVVIGASTLLYRYFEKPMMDLRDR